MKCFALLFVLLFIVSGNAAMYTNSEKLVLDGLNDYERHDLKKTMATWGIDSSDEVAKQIKAIEKNSGRLKEYKILGSVAVDEKNEVYYAAFYYEYSCCYLEVKLYDSIKRWKVVSVTMIDAETFKEKMENERALTSLEETTLQLKTLNEKVSEIEAGMKRIESQLTIIKKSVDGLKTETKEQ